MNGAKLAYDSFSLISADESIRYIFEKSRILRWEIIVYMEVVQETGKSEKALLNTEVARNKWNKLVEQGAKRVK